MTDTESRAIHHNLYSIVTTSKDMFDIVSGSPGCSTDDVYLSNIN